MISMTSYSVNRVYLQLHTLYVLLTRVLLRSFKWAMEKLFATEANLELELSLLEKEAVANEKMVQSQGQLDGDASEVKVTEMSEKILRINLSKAKKGKVPVPAEEEEDLQEDDLNSPDIQVIQEKNDRHLHGILKQRSRSHSESSDDIPSGCSYSRENSTSSGSHMSESPISESEEADLSLESRLRKSVSFNEHVDKTTFKPTATVCSMKTALKSKRRRNRKREDKKRRRHNSNGSEYSSSDEHPHHHSDTEVQEQEDTEEHDKVEGEADWEDGVPADKPCDKSKARSGQQDETVASLAEAYRTSPSGESVEKEPLPNEGSFHSSKAVHVQDLIPEQCNSVCGVEKSAPANDEKGHNDAQDLEPHDTEREPVPDENERTKHLKSSAGELCSGDANVCDDAPESGTNAVTVAGEKHLEESSSGQAADSVQTPKGVSSETMLRWTDQNATACSDHKTQCAFSFSNSVMFDLDVD